MDMDARDSDSFAARLEALAAGFDVLGLPVCVLDRGLRYRYVNADFVRHTGRTPADYLGRSVEEAYPKTPTDDRRERMRLALGGEAAIFNRRTTIGPNAGVWVRAHYLPMRDEAGAVAGVIVVLIDIQQLKDVEAALAERERHLSLIMDAVGFPIRQPPEPGMVRKVARRAGRQAAA
jgi:PAS domain S-box-containing protein